MELKTHHVHLQAGPLVLRPMTEDDWNILQPRQMDAEVLYYTDGEDVCSRTLEDTQDIWRTTSQTAFVFIVELQGRPIGECWLQQMNYPHILERYPNLDLLKIDMSICDKSLWGKGWGTVMIALLVQFGFEEERADAIFGMMVADYNPRSRRVGEKNGFIVEEIFEEPAGMKAKRSYNLMLTRERYATLGLYPLAFVAQAHLPDCELPWGD